jgi:Ca2+-transporting ATPase
VGVTVLVQLLLVYVPALQPIFETGPLTPIQLAVVLLASTLGFAVVEIDKAIRRWAGTRPSPNPVRG